MSLEQIYFISQIVAAVTLAFSLLFVGYQIRQNSANLRLNTDAVQLSAYHQAINQAVEAYLQLDLPSLLIRARSGEASLSESERWRLSMCMSIGLFAHEITLYLSTKGLIDPVLWANMLENNRPVFDEPHLALLRSRAGPLSCRLLQELEAKPINQKFG